jgi:hypothetical protein
VLARHSLADLPCSSDGRIIIALPLVDSNYYAEERIGQPKPPFFVNRFPQIIAALFNRYLHIEIY